MAEETKAGVEAKARATLEAELEADVMVEVNVEAAAEAGAAEMVAAAVSGVPCLVVPAETLAMAEVAAEQTVVEVTEGVKTAMVMMAAVDGEAARVVAATRAKVALQAEATVVARPEVLVEEPEGSRREGTRSRPPLAATAEMSSLARA